MTRAEVDKLLELPLPERFELAQALWGSIETEWDSRPVTERERRLLDESLEAYYRDPDAGTPDRPAARRGAGTPRGARGCRST